MKKYTVNQIAGFFISKMSDDEGHSITTLKLQKLVYYAQAWHYTILKKPLFSEKIEAWVHGPVVRELWEEYRGQPYEKPLHIQLDTLNVPSFKKDTHKLLLEIIDIYGERSGNYLEQLTHQEKPWKKARKGIPAYASSNVEISLESMKKFYSKMM